MRSILFIIVSLQFYVSNEPVKSFSDIFIYEKEDFNILDVYFSNDDYTLLTKQAIYSVNYNGENFNQKYSFENIITISDYSSITKINSTYYAISCFQNNTNQELFGIFYKEGNSLKLERSYSKQYISNTHYTCSISINSNQLFVGFVDESNNQFSSYGFDINQDSIFSKGIISQGMLGEVNVNTIFRCIAEGNDKVLCIMLDNKYVLYFEGNFAESTNNKTADKTPFINLSEEDGESYEYLEARITQCGENSYIIAAIKDQLIKEGEDLFLYSAQYFTPFKVGDGRFDEGIPTLRLEDIPDEVSTYSGALINNDLNNFYGVYVDGSPFLNVERVKYEGNKRTINLGYDILLDAKPINTYTTINNNIIHIILTYSENFILYRFQYPGILSCNLNTVIRITTKNTSFNVVDELNMKYDRIEDGFIMDDLNKKETNVLINTSYYASISGVTKKTYENNVDKTSLFTLNDDFENVYYSHDCTASYKVCHDFCEECEELPSTKKYSENPSLCLKKKCADDYAYLEDEESDCFSISDEVDGYILSDTGERFDKCYEACNRCTAIKTDTEMNCVDCKSGYTKSNAYCLICAGGNWRFDPSDITVCHYDSVDDCPDVKPYFIEGTTKCVDECPPTKLIDGYSCVNSCDEKFIYNNNQCKDVCPEDAPYTVENNKNCLSECPENKYISGNSCVSSCPIKTLDNTICVDECPEGSEETETDKCECAYGYDLNDDGTIQCNDISNAEDYKVTLGSECINFLKSSGKITNENEIIIDKKIIIREGEIVNQLEYKVKKTDGSQLDISSCSDITLTSPININYPGLDLKKIKDTSEKGYDILNPEDDFFNDICTKYKDENGADVPIKKRRQEYYQEFPLCESDCKYTKYNTDKNTVDCLCDYKEYSVSTERTYSVIKTDSDFKNGDVSNSNFKTMGCGKEAFKDIESNSAFWIILIGFILQVGCFGIFSVFKTKIIGILLFDAFKITLVSNPKNKEEEKDEKTIIGDDKNQTNKEIKNEDLPNNDVICYQEIEKEPEEEISEEDKMTHEGLNNMSYENALLYDDRSFFAYFWNIFIYNQMLLFMIFKDNWNFVITKISMFVNIITFALLFNLMFFGNKLIEEIYKNKGGLTMNKAFGWIVLAVVLTVILNCIAKYFGLTKRDVVNGKKQKENFNDEEFSSIVFKRTLIYFIVILIITLFIWYFGISFCGIYRDCQKKLVFYIFMTWLLIMLYPIPLCLVVALCRYIGIKKQIKGFYTFSKGMQWIIMV